MNFEFSDEQNLLREQASGFLADHCPLTKVRAILDSEEPYNKELYQKIAELGWTATTIPEEFGGIGLGHLELCVIAEELGRSLAPTPFASSVYLATEALLCFGDEKQKSHYLPGLASGELIGTLAISEGAGAASQNNLKTEFNGATVTGTKLPVPDGDVADFAVVLAKEGDNASLVIVDLANTERQAIRTVDPTRSQANITFNQDAGQRLNNAGDAWNMLDKVFDRAAVLFAFEQVGGAHAALDMARDYALERYAFGRSIASFQAIKHKLADMYIAATLARSNAYYGAWALATDAAELPIAAASARVSASEAYHECSKENIQTHGGMGFTWEFDCHMHYRRSKALSVNLGGLPRWKDRLISRLEESNRVTI